MFYGMSTTNFNILKIFLFISQILEYNMINLVKEEYIMNEYLVAQLKNGRLQKGLRQSDVSKITGIKNTTLSNYENGVTEPDMDTFLKLCELYELDFITIMEEAYGITVPGKNFNIKPSEIEFLKKYRAIGSESQSFIDAMLDREFSRVVGCDNQLSLLPFKGSVPVVTTDGTTYYIKKNQAELLNAAHSIPKATEEEKKHDEEIMNDLYF